MIKMSSLLSLPKNYQSPLAVPPTPRARPIQTISDEVRERFGGVTWIRKEDDRPISDYFVEYDHFEIFDERKLYSRRPYNAAYKGNLRTYQNHLCVLESDETEEHYVIAKRLPNELEQLIDYCVCISCAMSSYNPLKYVWCTTCTQCLRAGPGLARSDYIEIAKNLKNRSITGPAWRERLVHIKWIKIIEIAVAIIILLYILI